MKRLVAFLFVVLAGGAQADMTVNPAVTSENIAETICVPGYTKTIRPPVTYTNKIKRKLMSEAGIPWSDAKLFELDHWVALTDGGHPSSPNNLRLQAWGLPPVLLSDGSEWGGDDSAKVKDKLEVRLNHLICSGGIELLEAQQCIYDDWKECARQHP